MRIKDIFITNLEKNLVTEDNNSMPLFFQLVQNTYTKFTDAYGTIGNFNYAYTIELPDKNMDPQDVTPNIDNLRTIINEYKTIKISAKELLDHFFIFKIPDYGSQAMSRGMLDFLPIVMISASQKNTTTDKASKTTTTNDYTYNGKVKQNHIGIIRSYYSKQAFLIIDKDSNRACADKSSGTFYYYGQKNKVTINSGSCLIKFRPYYDPETYISKSKENSSGTERIEKLDAEMTLDNETNRYTCEFTTTTQKLSKLNFEQLTLYIKDGNNRYILDNCEIIKDFKLDDITIESKSILNEYVGRQTESNTLDYYRSIMAFIYNRLKNTSTDYFGDDDFKKIKIKVSIAHYFDIDTGTIHCTLNNIMPNIAILNRESDLTKNYNFTSTSQSLLFKYPYINQDSNNAKSFTSTASSLFDDLNFSEGGASVYEVIPLNSEDLVYLFKVTKTENTASEAVVIQNDDATVETTTSTITIDVTNEFKNRKIYKYKIDLSTANIFGYHSDGTFFIPKISSTTLTGLNENDVIFITFNQNAAENSNVNSTSETTSGYTISFINDGELKYSFLNERKHVQQDPFLFSSDSTENVINHDMTNATDRFLYDLIKFPKFKDVISNNEPYVTNYTNENTITKTIALVKTDEDSDIAKLEETVFKDNYENYGGIVSTLETQFTNLYNNHISAIYNNNKTIADINTKISNIKTTFLPIYKRASKKVTYDESTLPNHTGDFLCLGITVKAEEKKSYDLYVYEQDLLIFIEHQISLDNNKQYIHIPFYTTAGKTYKYAVYEMKDSTKTTDEYMASNPSNAISEYLFID